jgi:hypothetical protein
MNLLLIVLATSLLGLAHVSQSVHGASLPPEIQLPTGLVISQATRTVDVTSQIVKVKTDYQLRNEGKEELAFFVHTLTEAEVFFYFLKL